MPGGIKSDRSLPKYANPNVEKHLTDALGKHVGNYVFFRAWHSYA